MKITKGEFREICNRNGVQVFDIVLDGIYDDVAALESVAEEKNPGQKLLAAYCEVFKAVYNTNPPITGAAAGIAKRIAKEQGLERACALIQTYLAMKDQYFLTKGHDLVTFQMSLNKIAIAHDTGQVMTRKKAQTAESTQGNVSASQNYLAKKYGGRGNDGGSGNDRSS